MSQATEKHATLVISALSCTRASAQPGGRPLVECLGPRHYCDPSPIAAFFGEMTLHVTVYSSWTRFVK